MKRVRDGFALPAVLIASVVMMIVLMTGLTASSGMRANLDEQFYLKLAQEAAESGAVFAQDCMQGNDYIAPWSGRILRSGFNCAGTTQSYPGESYLSSNNTYRTRWTVASVPATTDQQFINVTGYVELVRSNNTASVWKTYSKDMRVQVSTEVGSSKVAFGYSSAPSGPSTYGAYFGALTSSGEVLTLGMNSYGQLGNGTTADTLTPQTFQLPADTAARSLFASFLSTGDSMYAITVDNRLYVAGKNDNGKLGVGTTTNVTTPQLVTTAIGGERVAAVDNNSWASYVITQSGKIYSAGECMNGVLGVGTTTLCTNSSVFRQVTAVGMTNVVEVVTDATTAFIRTADGRVFGWGLNTAGVLGSSVAVDSPRNIPIQVGSTQFTNSAGLRAVKLAFDGRTLYVIRDDGSLWAMGDNMFRQILNTTTAQYTTPQRINTPTGCNGTVTDVKTDRSHIAVLFSDGHVCTGGFNGYVAASHGWLGHNIAATGSTSDASGPAPPSTWAALRRVTGVTTYGLPSAFRAQSVSVNSVFRSDSSRVNNTFLVGTDGTVYGAGANYYGQLGNGTTTMSRVFTKMNIFGPAEPAKTVMSGGGTTVIYTASGRVYAVGNNSHGQIGNGSTTNVLSPIASKFLNIGSPVYF